MVLKVPVFSFVTDPQSGKRYGLLAFAIGSYRTSLLKISWDGDVDPNWVAPSG